jgi:magnesium transporter
MNFWYMPELQGRYSYYVLIAVVAIVCISLYRYLRKARWL